MNATRLFSASAALELASLRRQKAFVLLTALAAISLLAMVSLFGLTGAFAPVAIVNQDHGPFADAFIDAMTGDYRSFRLRPMSDDSAQAALRAGSLVGIITIPRDFSANIESGATMPIFAKVDNVDTDLTDDIQRALPAAIVAFGQKYRFPGLRVHMEEHDVLDHDTAYVPYLVVSALALDAMVIAGILGAMATAREWERRTIRMLRLSPTSSAVVLAGKLSVAAALAFVTLAITVLAIVLLYGVVPVSPFATLAGLGACVLIFTCIGAWIGALFKRTLAAVPLIFGLAMPFYIDSGALEPIRFDGNTIWAIAHFSPVYYAVGVLEWAFHGLHVTPEPVYADFLILFAIALVSVLLTIDRISKGSLR